MAEFSMSDPIEREAAMRTVFSMCCRWDTEDPNDLKNMLLTAFQELPSSLAQWEYVDYGGVGNYHCTNCRAIGHKNFKFCPYCGAKIRGN